MGRAIATSVCLLLTLSRLGAAQGLDSGFNPIVTSNTVNVTGEVFSIALQPDGRILIGGHFDTVNGATRWKLARLNADGALDGAFTPMVTPPGVFGVIRAIALQPDGRILVGGVFQELSGVPKTAIARLLADGSLDPSFVVNVGGGSSVDAIVVQPDGKILICGGFGLVNGVPRSGVVRLNADGSLDAPFAPVFQFSRATRQVRMALQSDGRIVIGGNFGSVDGTQRLGLARLMPDGSLDASFHYNPQNTTLNFIVPNAIAIRPDGRIVVGADAFLLLSEPGFRHIVQLHADGARDLGFNANVRGPVRTLVVQPDGKLLLGGALDQISGATVYRAARLHVDGSLDTSFGPFPAVEANHHVHALALQPDGKVLVGGIFGPGFTPPLRNLVRLLPQAPNPADSDADGLPTTWELQFGLDGGSATGDHGPSGDPDADGLTNAQELAGGTHPRGFHVPSLAEGALNSFFDVRLAFLNVGPEPARVWLRFLQPGGVTATLFTLLPPRQRWTLGRNELSLISSPDFSTVVESDQPIVVDRTMTWGATRYGSHAETAVGRPASTWYLAEGSTSDEFALFYLLQNPNATSVQATIRYLRPFGLPPIDRTLTLPPSSRTTIPVDDQGPELASTDISAVITAAQPILVERAMYISRPGQVFAAGHGSAGVTAPALRWFLAEGATGPFFDLFILVANPNPQPAEISVDYLLTGGTTHTKTYTVAPNGRFTIFVDDEQIPAGSGVKPLDNVAVSSTITSTNGVPVIVERTMWWPSPALTANFWTEAHNSAGATATAPRWALAEGEVGGVDSAETYILIANTSPAGGSARVTLYFEDGATAARTFPLLPSSRTSVSVSAEFTQAAGRRFAALVESLGAAPVEIVVERAMYTSPGGATWAAGTNALGTRLP